MDGTRHYIWYTQQDKNDDNSPIRGLQSYHHNHNHGFRREPSFPSTITLPFLDGRLATGDATVATRRESCLKKIATRLPTTSTNHWVVKSTGVYGVTISHQSIPPTKTEEEEKRSCLVSLEPVESILYRTFCVETPRHCPLSTTEYWYSIRSVHSCRIESKSHTWIEREDDGAFCILCGGFCVGTVDALAAPRPSCRLWVVLVPDTRVILALFSQPKNENSLCA